MKNKITMKNSDSFITGKRTTRFWLFYYVGLLLLSVGSAMLKKYNQVGNAFDPTALVVFFVIFFLGATGGHLSIFMIRKAAAYDHKLLSKRILPALIFYYIALFLLANFAVSLGVFGWFLCTGKDLSGFFPQLFRNELPYANVSLFKWVLFFTLVLFYILWQKSARREQSLIEANLKYRYNTLKSQLNPHFLFNSLNTLSEMVYTDAKKADNYIQKLSHIYRYILENDETDFVPLTDELMFVEEYFALQKERDNGKISLNIDVQNPHLYKIIPVSLQLLTENALKHNSMSEESPLTINIFGNDDMIVVSNVLQRKNVVESPTRTGLSNLNERVKLIMNRELIVTEENKQFIVKIPVIKI
jgi:two-component system, LytTR family, sensor kinase